MKKEIISIDIKQGSKIISLTIAATSLLFSLLGIVLTVIGLIIGSAELIGVGVVYILMPIFYFVFTYIFVAFFIWIYNLLSKKVGGVIYTVKEHH